MKIGIFDSGLGGLLLTKSICEAMPSYDYVYLGDTKHLPYGNRSDDTVFEFTLAAVNYLFTQQNCGLVILACNTASARALRRIQQEYLPRFFPDRRVLGVIIPMAEAVVDAAKDDHKIGVLATEGTVRSKAYLREIQKLNPHLPICQNAAPLLVSMLEYDAMKWIDPILEDYLAPLLAEKIDQLVLGCTHYSLLKDLLRKKYENDFKILCSNDVVPQKAIDYLARHPEIEKNLSQKSKREFLVTDLSHSYQQMAKRLFTEEIPLQKIDITPFALPNS